MIILGLIFVLKYILLTLNYFNPKYITKEIIDETLDIIEKEKSQKLFHKFLYRVGLLKHGYIGKGIKALGQIGTKAVKENNTYVLEAVSKGLNDIENVLNSSQLDYKKRYLEVISKTKESLGFSYRNHSLTGFQGMLENPNTFKNFFFGMILIDVGEFDHHSF